MTDDHVAVTEAAVPRQAPRILPASPAQQHLYLLHRSAPGAGAVVRCHALPATVDDTLIHEAVRGLVHRHEALRARFAVRDGKVGLLVDESARPDWRVIDVADAAAVRRQLTREAARPFDLHAAPPFRAALVRAPHAPPTLLLVAHHTIADNRSMEIIRDELADAYASLVDGRQASASQPAGQYADFVSWQSQWLGTPEAEAELDFWQRQPAGESGSLRLPFVRPYPAQDSASGTEPFDFSLPAEAVRALGTQCREAGTTVSTGLLAAFAVLISRYGGPSDIRLGVMAAGRTDGRFRDTVGPLENIRVLRCELAGAPSFREVLRRTAAVAARAGEHRNLPLECLAPSPDSVDDVPPPLGYSVAFAESGARRPCLPVPGGEITELGAAPDSGSFTGPYALGLEVTPDGDEPRAVLRCPGGLLHGLALQQLADSYRRLLSCIAKDPDRSVVALDILDEREYARLAPPPTETSAADERCCHELFAEQARRRPDGTAVIHEGTTLTYRELDRRGNRLAHRLRALGVGPETLVGLAMDRSADLVVAILGILKAGGAYVPLDPSSAPARLRYIVEDSGITHLVCGVGGTGLADGFAGQVIDPSEDALGDVAGAEHAPERTATADSLAYVIYTSGSTGHPKGTLIPHRNVTRLFSSTQAWFGFTERDVWSLFHSYAFDFSVWEIWGALLHGGTLVVVPYEVSRSPESMLRLLRRTGVTILNQTPSAFHQLMKAESAAPVGEDTPLALRYVVFGGEALDLPSLRPWMLRHGDERPRLVNMYGITETTVHVTYRPLTFEDTSADGRSAIGVPIPDLQLYVLDPHGRPVPQGVAGELYVGGAGLARGYLNRPELTAERFLPHPFGDDPHARVYRTGDLVRRLPGGDMEYCGRLDDQVQLRGFRVELGEVEAALSQSPRVENAVVVLHTDSPGGQHLTGYLLTEDGELDESALRAELADRLPDYMIPAFLVVLDRFPLTVNGKVDRDRLPHPRQRRAAPSPDLEAGRDHVERTLVRLWAEVLGHERIGIDSPFYSSGGDSIRSIQILAGAREQGLDFDIAELARRQTIRELAPVVRTISPTSRARTDAPFTALSRHDRAKVPNGVIDAYPLSALQVGMIYHGELTAGGGADGTEQLYHNVTSYHVRAAYSEEAWRRAIRTVIARHEILRASFDLDTFDEPMHLVHDSVPVPVSFEDLSHLSPEARKTAVEGRFRAERQRPFDWRTAPLIRFHVQRRSPDTFQLLVVEHHAILDGWSERSLLAELFARYRAEVAGTADPRPADPPASRFRTFVELERAARDSESERTFWATELAGARGTELPRRQRPTPADAPMACADVPFPASLSANVVELADLLGVPVRIVLLAAHLRVLAMLGSSDDVLTGVVYNGRVEEQDGDKALGVFLNTVPMRGRLPGGSWLDLIGHTAELDQRLQGHRRFPLAELSSLGPDTPALETYFNYTHFHVYDSVGGYDDLQVLDEEWVAHSDFPFGVEFSFDGAADALVMALRYDSGRFDAEQIGRFGDYYLNALRAMAEDPVVPYAREPLLSRGELEQRRKWNETGRHFPGDQVLHRIIGQQAARTPDLPAVRCEGESLTYRELTERANQLAHRLRELGAAPGRFVALDLERSPELMIGLLAVLKAGAAYVPVSREDPADRVRELLAEAEPVVVLSTEAGRDRLNGTGAAVECVDGPGPRWAACPAHDVPDTAGPLDPAYMIFTSGSTGRPKGVVVPHRAITNRLLWMQQEYRLDPGERVLQKTPYTFDVSVWEFFWPLISGAAVVLARPGGHRHPEYLTGLIEDEGVSTVHFVPSMLLAFLDSLDDREIARCASLTRVFCSGEALPHDLQHRCLTLLDADLHNLYGPTEAAVDVTFWHCRADGREVVPIGRPIANTETHVLDRDLNPVPLGVTGELYLGGVCLADGYHRRPGLTAERFLHVGRPDGTRLRLYRTGDLARWLPEGVLEFAGRTDDQMKINGMRVEPGEIEAVLGAHPSVGACAVLLESARLTAYVVPAGGGEPDLAACRSFLGQKLPKHMVPSVWRRIGDMPLTSSGKVDRKALPTLGAPMTEAPAFRVPPRDPWEVRLISIWEGLFGTGPISVDDDFFELGGHSLSALRLVSLIRAEFGARLSLSTVLDRPTVAAQAALLRSPEDRAQQDASMVTLCRGGARRPLFVVHPIGGNVFCYRALTAALAEDQPVHAFAARGFEPGAGPLPTVGAMAERYLTELLHVQPQGPYQLLGWSFGGLIAQEMAARLEAAGQEVRLLALLDTGPPGAPGGPRRPATADAWEFDEGSLLRYFAEDLCRAAGVPPLPRERAAARPGTGTADGAAAPVDASAPLDPAASHAQLLDDLRAAKVLPDLSPDQFERAYGVFRANVRALAGHQPAPYSGPLLYFHSADAEGTARAEYWRGSTDGAFTARPVHADHYTMLHPPHIAAVARDLTDPMDNGTRPY
ncbi:amino acid adenylation domain-containing protein [Streptomyces sp. NPDC060006]|uniref:amino acid adenylation domain-containing protein n=1 Tax=unclassified Streptomyces TaxID=2593676 RepID=UPI0036B59B63